METNDEDQQTYLTQKCDPYILIMIQHTSTPLVHSNAATCSLDCSFIRQNIPSLNTHLAIRLILTLEPQPNKILNLLALLPTILLLNLPIRNPPPCHDLGLVESRGAGIQRQHVPALGQVGQRHVARQGWNGDQVVYACAVRDRGCWGIWVCIDDFVAALFALADYGGDAAEDTFAFVVCGRRGRAVFGVVAVEDLGLGGKTGAYGIYSFVRVSRGSTRT